MVIDKRRCWRALQLTMFFNKHSSFFYRWLLGDKDTFHMAWRRVGQPYGMPMFHPEQDSENGPVLYQHDFQGRRFLQHRNQDKWDYDGGNIRIPLTLTLEQIPPTATNTYHTIGLHCRTSH